MKPPVIIGLIVVIVAVIALVVSQQPQPAPAVSLCDALPTFNPIDGSSITELKTEDLTVGTGAEAQTGKTVVMHYVGYLANGTKI
ncbi:MAG: hypothetical protein HC933_09790 [Pleurocapsa sp. SU_196_0]|nr:hypothetical protein [Pleurocapsa sp. SU_196_0]